MSSVGSRGKASFAAMLMVITASWLLILAETYVFFVVVRPLGPALHVESLPSALVKILLTLGLVVSLVGVMFAISWLYLRAFRIPNEAS